MDFFNAFNEMSRARAVENLESEPSLQHLAAHAATVLAPATGLESRGVLWGESKEGGTQGDPESGPYFCIAIQPDVVAVDQLLQQHGGCARFGWDDGYLMGPPEETFAALEKFSESVQQSTGLVLQRTKTEVFSMDTNLPIPEGLVRAGALVDAKLEPGMICYGVPIGTDVYVKHMLAKKVKELEDEATTISRVLEEERQALWTVLHALLAQKMTIG